MKIYYTKKKKLVSIQSIMLHILAQSFIKSNNLIVDFNGLLNWKQETKNFMTNRTSHFRNFSEFFFFNLNYTKPIKSVHKEIARWKFSYATFFKYFFKFLAIIIPFVFLFQFHKILFKANSQFTKLSGIN